MDYFLRSRPLDRDAVQECAGLAQAHATISKFPSAEASVDLPLTAEALIERDRLMEAVAPAVTRVRQKLFNMTTPPFPDAPEKAVKWIEAEAGKQGQASDDDRLLAKMLLRELEKTMDQCAGLLREELVLSRSSRRLSYLMASEPRDVAVVPGSPLDVLEDATRRLSEWTGFNPMAMVVAYIDR